MTIHEKELETVRNSQYQIFDGKTGYPVGKPVNSLKAASRKVDRLDNAYGSYRYTYKNI